MDGTAMKNIWHLSTPIDFKILGLLIGIVMLTWTIALYVLPIHAETKIYPVPVILTTMAIEEETHFIQAGEYVEPENLPDGKLSLERLDQAGYGFWWVLNYKNDKANEFLFQAWKHNACENNGTMSYYIQQKDSLRFRCSVDNTVANEKDKKVQ
jgi:hypothetical protein